MSAPAGVAAAVAAGRSPAAVAAGRSPAAVAAGRSPAAVAAGRSPAAGGRRRGDGGGGGGDPVVSLVPLRLVQRVQRLERRQRAAREEARAERPLGGATGPEGGERLRVLDDVADLQRGAARQPSRLGGHRHVAAGKGGEEGETSASLHRTQACRKRFGIDWR